MLSDRTILHTTLNHRVKEQWREVHSLADSVCRPRLLSLIRGQAKRSVQWSIDDHNCEVHAWKKCTSTNELDESKISIFDCALDSDDWWNNISKTCHALVLIVDCEVRLGLLLGWLCHTLGTHMGIPADARMFPRVSKPGLLSHAVKTHPLHQP